MSAVTRELGDQHRYLAPMQESDGTGAAHGSSPGPPREQLAQISTSEVRRDGREAVVVTVAGEIDIHTVDRLRGAVAEGLARVVDEPADGIALVIDLTDVTFLGSQGLTALVEATKAAQRRKEPLRIVVDHTRPVIRPIELTGLRDLLALYRTVEEALGVEI